MAYITEPVDEKHAFAPSELHVLQAVQHCLLGAPAVPGAPKSVPDANTQITLQMFLNWAMGLEGFKGHGEPHTLVWLPTLHRIGATENSKHEKKCAVRCAFFGRNLHPRMPLDPTHVRLKRTCV
jgi:hypothetical protein